jgi:hypothetical protein
MISEHFDGNQMELLVFVDNLSNLVEYGKYSGIILILYLFNLLNCTERAVNTAN